jgi:hypothetical protein
LDDWEIKQELEGNKNPSDITIMEMLSREYGWTPSQIKEQRFCEIEKYVDIISVRNLIEKTNLKK